jgi:hypothetical protein
MAKASSDPAFVAGLVEAAADLKEQVGELPAPDTSKEPDVRTAAPSGSSRSRDPRRQPLRLDVLPVAQAIEKRGVPFLFVSGYKRADLPAPFRDRLLVEKPIKDLKRDIAAKFPAAVLAQPKVKKRLSSDHFSVDGTLIEAWASIKNPVCRPSSAHD